MTTDIAVEEQRANHLIAQETIDAIVQVIADRLSPKLIILFGSYASGCPRPIATSIYWSSWIPIYSSTSVPRRSACCSNQCPVPWTSWSIHPQKWLIGTAR